MKFDLTISLGVILHGIAMVWALGIATRKIITRYTANERKINILWDMLIGSADGRVKGLDQRIEHAVRAVFYSEEAKAYLARLRERGLGCVLVAALLLGGCAAPRYQCLTTAVGKTGALLTTCVPMPEDDDGR